MVAGLSSLASSQTASSISTTVTAASTKTTDGGRCCLSSVRLRASHMGMWRLISVLINKAIISDGLEVVKGCMGCMITFLC